MILFSVVILLLMWTISWVGYEIWYVMRQEVTF